MKELNANEIKRNLNDSPSIWVYKRKNNLFESIQSLYEYISNNNYFQNLTQNYQSDSSEIPYNQSLFHFILYFTYYPKISFVFSSNHLLVFGSFYGKNLSRVELSFPIINNHEKFIKDLDWLISTSSLGSILKRANISKILLRDIPDEFISQIRRINHFSSFHLTSLKELYYQTYDLTITLKKTGKQFSNLRWHLNKFNKSNHTLETVPLSNNIKEVIHLIGSWKRKAIKKRGFSFINLDSDKLAARLFGKYQKINKNNNSSNFIPLPADCLSRVLKVDGEVKSFNFGYPLGIKTTKNTFAHAIGISDISVPHLAEYAQYDFWKQIQTKGYSFINDGPSWKKSLEIYKQKFRPLHKKRYYFITLTK